PARLRARAPAPRRPRRPGSLPTPRRRAGRQPRGGGHRHPRAPDPAHRARAARPPRGNAGDRPGRPRGFGHLDAPGRGADDRPPGRRRRPPRHVRRAHAPGHAAGRPAERALSSHRLPPRGARMIPAAGTWPVAVLSRRIGDYLALSKPRVVLMVLVTTVVGYYLGSAGTPRLGPLLQTLVGTALAAGGTLALNPLVERDRDGRVERT